jgi:hypothetical protein
LRQGERIGSGAGQHADQLGFGDVVAARRLTSRAQAT